MGYTLTEKILRQHLANGSYEPGKEIGIKIDQTLTQDATGTMAYLQFESMGLSDIATELSVSYVDHNTIQVGFENADDHAYLESIAKKYGIYFSRPGNGICHQVHLERFARPGKTLLGSDSHTPTAGGVGSLAMGAGGLDVAVAMGGGAYYLTAPRVINVHLTGRLQPWATAKDVVLKVLSILSTKGNVGCVCEYTGEGIDRSDCAGESNHHQYGRRDGRDYIHLPQRQADQAVPAGAGKRRAMDPSGSRQRCSL